ncbi:symmetrical bis(5'-nucleosyl)-tetraphosphatase [Shewanella sp. Isolate11]|uniref:symmetrical bis(5'-nucleosyl)-tetraphosphatase n=1 Tax=Shewanella sp. Isolate11 TaxID=2908530 RepID=UPI001EFD2283|nr:symmetrical bis(5'-nucleosyl)-tetraphosphatase [Shewanella sp. Isolate11]MCG9695814.1 symmetrical bis(5'-nucleosyl)-tetraphosphatase [Shewanella sp. Isolate11]
MATYFIGDIQGCFDELQAILAKVEFNPSKDELWIVGDMVARGDKSLETLRYIKSLDDAAKPVLGNHDLHLLALHNKIKRVNPSDKLGELLNAPDCPQLIDWLRTQPLIRQHPKQQIVMTHAGIPPQWNINTATTQAAAVEQVLRSDNYLSQLIAQMYTNDIDSWSAEMPETEQLVYCVNALTRMRYLYADGRLDFDCKQPPESNTNPLIKPWFLYPRADNNQSIMVFGHWAALMGQVDSPQFKALDTGCCWGEHLTLWHLETNQKITQNKLKKS